MRGTTADGADPFEAGQDALGRADWVEARARFQEAVATHGSAAAWEGLCRAAWWLGDEQATFAARGRAFREYLAHGDARGAARMAAWTASDHLDFRGDDAVASAWLRRARGLIEELDEQCAEHGLLLLMEADVALLAQADPTTAAQRSREALAIADTLGDPGVEVVGLAILGCALVASGAIDEGLQRLDEAAALAVGEVFEDVASPGWALCHTVSACADVGDFNRAGQWCRALHEWSTAWRARHFFGVCRTAYGEVLATAGEWSTAEQELRSAMNDTRAARPALAAPTAVRLGRLRLRQGDAVEARALFETALPLPQAILALGELDLAAGEDRAAAEAADRVLRRLGGASVLDRFPALELLARALAAGSDLGAAMTTLDTLEEEAGRMATAYMRGRARLVRAQVLGAGTDHDGARRAAEDAMDLFAECSAPYEAAQARLALASTLSAMGREQRADLEERTARAALHALGVRGTAGPPTDELTLRELEILRLVARGRSDAQIADQLFLSVHTVHRHIANIRTKLNVSSRAAAVGHAARHGLLEH